MIHVDGQQIYPNTSFTLTDLKVIKPPLLHGTMKMSSVLLVHSVSLYQSNCRAFSLLNEIWVERLASYFELTHCLHQSLVPHEAQSFWLAHLDQSHCREHCWKNVAKLEKNVVTHLSISLYLSLTHAHTYYTYAA